MPENQDKKIFYKILTAEELLKEEVPPTKEIGHKEEKIEVPVDQKIEDQKEVTVKKEEEKPIEKVIIEPPIKEEPSREEIFYTPQREEIPFRPKPEFLQKEAERKEIPKRELRLSTNLLKFVFIGGGVILVFLLILFLRPQEKFKALFRSKETKKGVEITIPTPTVVLLPTTTQKAQTATSNQEEKEVLSGVSTRTLEIPMRPEKSSPQDILIQTGVIIPSGINFLTNFPSRNIILENSDFSTWQEKFKKFLSLQEFSGTKINVNFLYNNNKIPFDFLLDYFIKPTSSTNLVLDKNNFTGNYSLLIYYGYSRKYPILIFEVKDKKKAIKFNQEWEKLTMKEDLKTLFLGLEPPKTKNNFVTKKQGNYSYRILDFGDNFEIIWALADNYLIYSTTEMGLKDIFSLLQ
jgi:hypothetical protein